MGDWTQLCLGECKLGQNCGIRNRTQRAMLVPKFKYLSASITEIIEFQYRAPQKQEKGVYFFSELHKSCLKNQFELIPRAYCRIDISIGF